MDPATERLHSLLAALTDYERKRTEKPRWSLDGMRDLIARGVCRVPDGGRIQVGGSKGKGTTTVYVEALARSCGLSTGAYLSPHVDTILERFRIDGAAADEADVHTALAPVLAVAATLHGTMTFFEALTAAACNLFAAKGVALSIFEVGLGGRLDATTAIPVDVSVLTNVELEHVEWLGDTVEAIAAEKAPVLRPGGRGVTAATGAALGVVADAARAVGNDLWILGREFDAEAVVAHSDGFRGRLRIGGEVRPFFLPNAAPFEVGSLALAAAALHRWRPELRPVLDPAPRVPQPGRFEVRVEPDGGVLILDGAHTQASLAGLFAEIARRWPGRKVALLFGSAVGKRWREGLRPVLTAVDRAWTIPLTDTTSEDPAVIRDWLIACGTHAECTADVASGLAALRRCAAVRVVTGSFYLVGAVRRWLQHSQD